MADTTEPLGTAKVRDKDGNLTCARTVDPATVNREVVLLKLALGLVGRPVPKIANLKESEARSGFPTPDEMDRLVAALPERLRGWARFLQHSGWRAREALGLRWDKHVDLAKGIIRREADELKTRRKGNARILPFRSHPVVARIVADQYRAAKLWERENGSMPTHVFWRAARDAGKHLLRDANGCLIAVEIVNYSSLWNAACRKAGVRQIPHNLRRGFARDGVRAGLDEKTIMQLAGWKSRAVFDRYSIRNEDDLAEGLAKMAAASTVTETAKERAEERKA